MRWGDFRRSDNVEDRTGQDAGGGGFPGGGFPGGGMRLGGGAIVVIVIASLLFGVNPLEMLGVMEGDSPPATTSPSSAPAPGYGPRYTAPPGGAPSTARPQDPTKDMVARVLGDTEEGALAVRVNEALRTLQARGLIRVEYGGVRVLDLAGLQRARPPAVST